MAPVHLQRLGEGLFADLKNDGVGPRFNSGRRFGSGGEQPAAATETSAPTTLGASNQVGDLLLKGKLRAAARTPVAGTTRRSALRRTLDESGYTRYAATSAPTESTGRGRLSELLSDAIEFLPV